MQRVPGFAFNRCVRKVILVGLLITSATANTQNDLWQLAIQLQPEVTFYKESYCWQVEIKCCFFAMELVEILCGIMLQVLLTILLLLQTGNIPVYTMALELANLMTLHLLLINLEERAERD